MKKSMIKAGIIMICLLAVAGVITGCKAKETINEEYQFDATVLEIQEEYIMVEALEGQV